MTSAKDEKIIKELRSRPENKKCMDCSATFPTYVVLDFGTWVCTTCSGIHREFSHKVKSPTMATFKPDEINLIQHGGNENARKKWRARWTNSNFPEPDSGDVHRIREFIKLTYKEKKWYETNPSSSAPNPSFSASTSGSIKIAEPAKKPEPVKSLIDFDFDVTPSAPPVNTNPFAPDNLNAMFSNFQVTQPHQPPASNNTNPFASAYDPNMYPPFIPPTSGQPVVNHAPPANTGSTNPFFDFDSLGTVGVTNNSHGTNNSHVSINSPLRPPPKEATIRQPTAPVPTQPRSAPADDSPKCPICNRDVKGLSNDAVNQHIDKCLASGGSTEDDDWAQWFDLGRKEWYFGDIDRKEAERILFRCGHDSFLVRKSSVKDAFAVSLYNHKKQTVTHSLIEKRNNGWAFQDTYRVYSTLVEVISDSPECKGLKPPPKM